MNTTPHTTTDFTAAIERELSKRRTTYPRIIAKKQKAGVSTEEIMDIATTQRIQFETLETVHDIICTGIHYVDPFSAHAYRDELQRELKMRKKAYPRWVYLKRMNAEVAASEIAVWAALVEWWKQNYCIHEKQEV